MKKLLLYSILFSTNLIGQSNRYESTINLIEHNVLFWNVKNRIEFVGPEKMDSLDVLVSDGDFFSTGPNTGYIIPRTKNIRKIKVELVGWENKNEVKLLALNYNVLRLPNPNIYLSKYNLNSNLLKLSDKALFSDLYFRAHYDAFTSKLIGILDCNFQITEWRVKVGKVSISGSVKRDYDHLFAAITNAKKGTKIKFESFELIGPDGTKRNIVLNSIYAKKGKKDEVIERKVWNLNKPD